MYMKAGWTTIRTSRTVQEVIPSHDIIDHKSSMACKCNPKVESEVYDGVAYWMIIHNSFDEFLSEDQTEPYKGI